MHVRLELRVGREPLRQLPLDLAARVRLGLAPFLGAVVVVARHRADLRLGQVVLHRAARRRRFGRRRVPAARVGGDLRRAAAHEIG